MSINTVDFQVTETVAEIVSQGYSDTIEDWEEHHALCNQVDKELLPAGAYWLERVERLADNWGACELTGVQCELWKVTAAYHD